MDINAAIGHSLSISYYRNCGELPIWNFHNIGKVKDFRYLVKGWDGVSKVFLKGDEVNIWEDIFNEYCDLSDNKESQEYLRNVAEKGELEKKYVMVSMLLSVLYEGVDREDEQKYFEEISKWGFSFNQGDLSKEIKRANVWLKSIKTRINILDSDINEHQKKTTRPETLERHLVKLERITGKNEINPKTTSVTKFLEIIKDSEEMAKKKKKAA